ncbi:hypothetical protein AGMMS49975_26190 [Clostridia bacterium]|nr:hypothetical protein AGMMS49975_26190 [Clostridia bacterium]
MDELKIFEKEEFGAVRVLEIEGTPWFVGKDVAKILGYEVERNAIERHVDKEDALKRGVGLNTAIDGNGKQIVQQIEMTLINESGVYSLIMGSKLPKAWEFKRWVTHEVLPSIRKTGEYSVAYACGEGNAPTVFNIEDLRRYVDVDGCLELISSEVNKCVRQTLQDLKPGIIDTLIQSVNDFLEEYDVANGSDIDDKIYNALYKSDFSYKFDTLVKDVGVLKKEVKELKAEGKKKA